jgi:hypothetical protein
MNFHDEMIDKKCGAVVIAIWYLHMESPIEFALSLENAWFQYNFFHQCTFYIPRKLFELLNRCRRKVTILQPVM